MSLVDRTLVTLVLGGVDYGTWETMGGRETDSDGDTYRPGAGQSQRAFGGPGTYSDITLGRTYLQGAMGVYKDLLLKRGKARGSVTETELDEDYNAFGDNIVWPVLLKGVTRSDVDINGNDRKMLTVTLWVDGDPA